MLDYKFRSIKRTADATFLTMVVYEGEDGLDADGKPQYQRSWVVEEHELRFRGDVSDGDLRAACNERLADLANKSGKASHPAQVVREPARLKPVAERVNVRS